MTQIALCKKAMFRVLDGTIDLNTNQFEVALLADSFIPVVKDDWVPAQLYTEGTFTVSGGLYYEALNDGRSSGSLPALGTVRGETTNDNTVTWLCWGLCPPAQYDLLEQVVAHEVSGTNYARIVLSTPTLTELPRRRTRWSVADTYFGEMEVTPKYAAIFRAGAENGVTNPLVAYVLLDDAGLNLTMTLENPFTLQWSADGILSLA